MQENNLSTSNNEPLKESADTNNGPHKVALTKLAVKPPSKPISRSEQLRKQDVKIRTFAKNFIEEGANGSRAYKKTINNYTMDSTSASVQANRLLRKDKTQEALMELLPSDDEDSKLIKQAYKQSKPDNISWEALHKYLTTSLTLKGRLNNKDSKGDTNIALVINS